MTIVASTPAGVLSMLYSINLVLAKWSRLHCKRGSTFCSAWRMVQNSIEGPLYAVSFFAICLILLFDTSGCKSFSSLRQNCHKPLSGLCGSLVGMLAERKLLIRTFFFWRAFLDLCPKRAPSVLAENTGLSCSCVIEKCAF